MNLDPYPDPVGIWTIGWGHAIRDTRGKYVRDKVTARALYPDGITIPQAEELLYADLLEAAKDVAALVKVSVTDNQFAALTSFEFNLGSLRTSTLLRKLNTGDYEGAAREFSRWVKGTVNGNLVTLPGLVNRRQAEKTLFEKED